jgi:hypothetical protein
VDEENRMIPIEALDMRAAELVDMVVEGIGDAAHMPGRCRGPPS